MSGDANGRPGGLMPDSNFGNYGKVPPSVRGKSAG